MHKAVFLDRDGTVVVDRAYLDNVEGIELLPGVGEALARLAAKGFLLHLAVWQQFAACRVEVPARMLPPAFSAVWFPIAPIRWKFTR